MKTACLLLLLVAGAAGCWYWYTSRPLGLAAIEPVALEPGPQPMAADPAEPAGPSEWELGELQKAVDMRDRHLRRLWSAGEYHLQQLERARTAGSRGERDSALANARAARDQVRPLRAVVLDMHERVVRKRERLGLPRQALPPAPAALSGTAFDLGDRLPDPTSGRERAAGR